MNENKLLSDSVISLGLKYKLYNDNENNNNNILYNKFDNNNVRPN